MARKERYIKTKKYKGNTYYTVQFQYGDKHNKHTYSKTFNSADYDTPVQALNAACEHRDIKRAELATQGLPSRKLTVEEAFKHYLKTHPRAEATETAVTYRFNRYIKPKYGNEYVSEIDEWTVSTHLESLRNDCTDMVIKTVLSVWKNIFKAAKGLKAITVNPIDCIEPPKSTIHKEKRKQSFTDEEMEKVIAELISPNGLGRVYDRAVAATMIRVARYTGLRPREIKGLRREDIDFETNTIYVRPNNTRNIKTPSSIRAIPMNSIARAELLGLLAISEFEYPFSFSDGKLPKGNDLSTMISRSAKRAGVPDFHLYGMRHSFDSELITSGVDPRTVMELMGHNDVQTTLATYARSTEEKHREAIEKVENGRKLS
jgi:integrase